MLVFRDNCEELRSTLSQHHQDEVFHERHEQLRMKEEQKKRDAEVEGFYADLWAKDIAIKRQKEEETARDQIERNRETLKVLSSQFTNKAELDDLKYSQMQKLEIISHHTDAELYALMSPSIGENTHI